MKKQFFLFLAISFILVSSKAQNAGFKVFGEEIDYQSATIALTTINTALTTLNTVGITPKWQSKYISGVAIATGAVQLGLGIYDARKSFTSLNIVNMTAGAATIITNSYLLYKTFTKGSTNTSPNKKKGKQPSSWNLYSSPLPLLDNKMEVGIRFTRNF